MNQDALEQVFTATFSEYGDAIFRFAVVKVSDPTLAEDMTQEVFMRYWQYLRQGRDMTNTRAFLYTIANNLSKDWYKRKKATSLDAHMAAGYTPSDSNASPELAAEYRVVLAAMEELEAGDAEVLLLRYVEGFEPREIAVLCGETANVVSVRLTRATKRLRDKLGL